MAASTSTPLVSVEEYIARFVEGGEKPICEYEDGELIPKSLSSKKCSQVQANLIRLIRRGHHDVFNPLPELTTRIGATKFFVPDLAVEELAKPIPGRYPGPNDPVLLCVEIISPPDRVGKLFGKCEEYHRWGVPYCWVIDPERAIAWEYFPNDLEPRRAEGELTAGPIRLALAEVFWRV
jgi:Uma2 family endonuclease